jgi:LuxR family maltose regulon positive regulatory protein
MMRECLYYRLTFVCAPAGAGKTTLLREFSDSTDVATIWYQLDRYGRDPAVLISGLCQAIGSSFDAQDQSSYTSEDWKVQPALPRLTALLEQMARFRGGQIVLILEDYHRLEGSEEIDKLMTDFLELAPPCVHLVISSRSVPALPLSRLRLQGKLLEITQNDLLLNPSELSAFLAGSGLKLSEAEEKLVFEKTGGWIAGIRMLVQSLASRPKGEMLAFLADFSGSSSLIYDYFAEEVFRQQSSSIQQFLMATATLRELQGDFVNALLGIDDGQAILETLAASNLFLIRLDDHNELFRYHQLFRGFLVSRARRTLGQAAIRRMDEQIAHVYVSRKVWSRAIDHLCAAGKYEEAAAIADAQGEVHLERGYLETVNQWLQPLPEDLRNKNPKLLLLAGIVAQRKGHYEEAIRSLSAAQTQFAENGDTDHLAIVASERSMVSYRMRNYREAVDLLEFTLASVTDVPLRAQMLNRLCTNYMELGDLDRAARFGEASLEVLVGSDSALRPGRESRSLRYLAETYTLRGELDRALSMILKANELCSQEQFGELERAYLACGMAAIRAVRGESELALKSLHEAEEFGARYVAPQRLRMNLWRGNILTDLGQLSQAEACYQAADFPPAERAWLHVRQHQAGRAILIAREALESVTGNEPLRRAALVAVLGLALGASGQERKAIGVLNDAEHTLENHNYIHHLVSIRLHIARLTLRVNQTEAGIKLLRDTVDIAESRGFSHFYWWDPQEIAWLLEQAIDDEHVLRFAERLMEVHTGEADRTALSKVLGQHRESAKKQTVSRQREDGPSPQLIESTLASCSDPTARARIEMAMNSDPITARCVLRLRSDYGFTWREIEVFVVYYLDRRFSADEGRGRLRRELANELCMTENTLKSHVKRIRRKLDLPEGADSLQVYRAAAGYIGTDD